MLTVAGDIFLAAFLVALSGIVMVLIADAFSPGPEEDYQWTPE